MSEKSLLEKLGVQYQEIEGIFYPLLSVTTEEKQTSDKTILCSPEFHMHFQ